MSAEAPDLSLLSWIVCLTLSEHITGTEVHTGHSAGFTVCPAVATGPTSTLYQAVNAFAPGVHSDFGAAASGSYQLDPGLLQNTLDASGQPGYALRDAGSATTAGACPQL